MKDKTLPIITVKDFESGLLAYVYKLNDGRYSVVLKDTDADETLPFVRIYGNLDSAREYAFTLTDGD